MGLSSITIKTSMQIFFQCTTTRNLFGFGKSQKLTKKTAPKKISKKESKESSGKDDILVSMEESRRFIVDCMECVGTPKNHAQILADSLIEADYRGLYHYGMKQLEVYVCDVKSGICDASATPKIIQENRATAWVDGRNGLGAVVGNFCMDVAIEKAKRVGVGWVSAKGSNHFGIAGMYTTRALCQGFIGLSFSNTSPYMCPTRATQPVLGTNPLSAGAPAAHADGFLLDMATTVVDIGRIEEYKDKNKPIPKGWAQDCNGKITTDATTAYEAGCLMPLGGTEIHSGYNGYGVGLLVEILCGVLGGGQFGPNIRKWGDVSEVANLSQCFIALNPDCFAPGFLERMEKHIGYIRCMEPTDPSKPVLIHGDRERLHMEEIDKAGGFRYRKPQIDVCKRLASSLDIAPLKTLS